MVSIGKSTLTTELGTRVFIYLLKNPNGLTAYELTDKPDSPLWFKGQIDSAGQWKSGTGYSGKAIQVLAQLEKEGLVSRMPHWYDTNSGSWVPGEKPKDSKKKEKKINKVNFMGFVGLIEQALPFIGKKCFKCQSNYEIREGKYYCPVCQMLRGDAIKETFTEEEKAAMVDCLSKIDYNAFFVEDQTLQALETKEWHPNYISIFLTFLGQLADTILTREKEAKQYFNRTKKTGFSSFPGLDRKLLEKLQKLQNWDPVLAAYFKILSSSLNHAMRDLNLKSSGPAVTLSFGSSPLLEMISGTSRYIPSSDEGEFND